MGLVKPDAGKVFAFGRDITAMSERDLFDIRSKIGMLFQESALFDSLTIEENVAYPLLNQKSIHCPPDEVQPRVEQALEFVELAGTLEKFPERAFRRHAPPRRDRARVCHRTAAGPLRFAHRRPRPDHGAHHHGAADQGARPEPHHHADGDAPLSGREPDREFPLQFGTRASGAGA